MAILESGQLVNKVVVGGETLIDLSGDTATADKVLSGAAFHLRDGSSATGTCPFDADTSDANATAAEILLNKTAYAIGNKITGTMPNNGAVTGTIATVAGQYTIPQGYHDGSGKVSIDSVEQAKLIAANIREGIVLMGITGTMSGLEAVSAQDRTVTASLEDQTITPEEGYNYLSQVKIDGIPVTKTENSAGGYTVTIG